MSEHELQTLEILSDQELLNRTARLARGEARFTALLVAHLAEIDARRLYLGEGCASLFAYCVEVLGISEPAAYRRIQAARVARRFPLVLDYLSLGRLHLGALSVLGPLLTGTNHRVALERAAGRTRREMEELAAELRSEGMRPTTREQADHRMSGPGLFDALTMSGEEARGTEAAPPGHATGPLPGPPGEAIPPLLTTSVESTSTSSLQSCPGRPEQIPGSPLVPEAPQLPPGPTTADTSTPGVRSSRDRPVAAVTGGRTAASTVSSPRFTLVFNADAETRALLFEARDLLRHTIPGGELDLVLARAMGLLVRTLRARKYGELFRRGGRREADGAGPAGLRARARAQTAAPAESPDADRSGPRTESARPVEGARRSHRTRYIPTAVRRAVWLRDGGRCTFLSAGGRRCAATGQLEFHHRVAFARGGSATAENIELRCRAHNQYEEAPRTTQCR